MLQSSQYCGAEQHISSFHHPCYHDQKRKANLKPLKSHKFITKKKGFSQGTEQTLSNLLAFLKGRHPLCIQLVSRARLHPYLRSDVRRPQSDLKKGWSLARETSSQSGSKSAFCGSHTHWGVYL